MDRPRHPGRQHAFSPGGGPRHLTRCEPAGIGTALEPATPGSTVPGIQGVGAGFETATEPAQAIRDFGSRVYGAQPGFTAGPVTPVAGLHPGEQRGVLTYLRSGVDVRVVLHSFRSGTRTVLLLGRSANAQPALAAQLEAELEASLKIAG